MSKGSNSFKSKFISLRSLRKFTLKFLPRITRYNRQTIIWNISTEILLDFNFLHSQNFLHNIILHRRLSLIIAKLTLRETDYALSINKFLLILRCSMYTLTLSCNPVLTISFLTLS